MEEENGVNSLKEIGIVFFNKVSLIIKTIIIFVILGGFFSFYIRQNSYVATASIMFSRVAGYVPQEGESQLLSEIQFNSSIIGNYKNYIISDDVLKTVIENLKLEETLGDLKEKIELESNMSNLDVIVTNKNEEMAEKIANEIMKVFIEKSKNFYQIEHTYTVNYANESTTENEVNHIVDLLVFAILGLFTSCACIYVKYMLNPVIVTEEKIENKLGLSVVSLKKCLKDNNSEPINLLRAEIEISNNAENSIKSLLVTSTEDDNSTFSVIANLAKSFASTDKKILIVDLVGEDNIFNIDNNLGFYDYFSNIKKNNIISHTDNKNIDIINKGKNDKDIVISKEKMLNFINDVKVDYDYVILNSPDILNSSNTRIISNICDGIFIKIQLYKTEEKKLVQSIKEIKKINGNILNIIVD